ncbi:unnamed protein product [Auanema sp. JU1783]|nr:unnamed protein product [Auanema sp. JU1783]
MSSFLRAVRCSPNHIRRAFSDVKPNASEATGSAKAETAVEGHKPMYATRQNFQKELEKKRYQNASIESGQRPTNMQRRFLVLTKLYKKQSEIPEIVSNGTMNRMHDRLRVVFILTGCIGFFSIFYIGERINARKIARDRDAGVVVTKM